MDRYELFSVDLSSSSEGAGNPPGVGLFVAVVQGLEALLFLLFAEARRVGHFEEGGRELHEPARVDGGHLAHVLLCGEDQLVIHHPFRLSIKQGARGVDVDHLLVDQSAVSLLRILFGCISEEATANGLLNTDSCFTT